MPTSPTTMRRMPRRMRCGIKCRTRRRRLLLQRAATLLRRRRRPRMRPMKRALSLVSRLVIRLRVVQAVAGRHTTTPPMGSSSPRRRRPPSAARASLSLPRPRASRQRARWASPTQRARRAASTAARWVTFGWRCCWASSLASRARAHLRTSCSAAGSPRGRATPTRSRTRCSSSRLASLVCCRRAPSHSERSPHLHASTRRC
mmetsp:Transcript_29712/g.62509  ORF Transcript_29712/g.62509 Transcript_29712/m.62509 type:complete len:203 (+) Transcript_29712:967-1575(+)